MLYAKQYLPVNWIDGMKLSRQNFIDTDNHTQDLVRDSVSLFLNNYNYGLLPPVKGAPPSHTFDLFEKITNYIDVRLSGCNAITQGGCRISINPEVLKFQTLTASFAVEATADEKNRPEYDVIVQVNPFLRKPVGTPDPDETPLRHPYTENSYQLKVVHSQMIDASELGSHHLLIGRIIYNEGRYLIDDQFIPPCSSIASHPRLITYYKAFGWGMNEVQVSSFKILRKIYDLPHPGDLTTNIQMLCIRILDYLSTVFFEYRNLSHQQPPIFIVRYFADLTSIIFTVLYCLPPRQKEEVLNYFYEWSNVTPGQFEELLLNLLEHDYNHNLIHVSMQVVEQFLDVFTKLWNKLSSLDYIGQRKETILVREETVSQLITKRRGWTILD